MADEIKSLIENQGKAFEEFKKAQNEQMEALKKGNGTAELQSKMDKIISDYDASKTRMDQIHADVQSLKVAPKSNTSDAQSEAFNLFCRKNDASKLKNLAQVGVDADGGYTCPADLSSRISSIVQKSNPIRQLAMIETTSRANWEILTDPNEMTATRITESGTRADTSTPQIGKITINPSIMYVYPKTTQELLDDSAWNFENWLVEKASRAFSNLERTEMATGNGVNCSEGITTPTKVADANWAWGSLGYILTGASGAISTAGADLVEIVDALEDPYRTNAAWIFNKTAYTSYRKLRGGANAANLFLFWTPSLIPGAPDSFLGYPVYTMSTMPSPSSNAVIAAFGDFKAGYTIVDRMGMNITRDNLTSPGFVKFHMYRRSSARVTNYEAIKLLRCTA